MWYNTETIPNPLHSITCYRKYGITPKTLGWLLKESPSISRHKDCLSSYFLLYWSGHHLLKQLQVGKGTITKESHTYIAMYSPSCTRGYILAHPEEQYSLSFRAPLKEFNLQAYVYISKAST